MEENRGYLLVGTYTGSGSKGVNIYVCDYQTGSCVDAGYGVAENPSYVVLDGPQKHLYAVSEGEPSAVYSFSFGRPHDILRPLNVRETGEEGLCNIIVSPDGGYVLTANYGSGSLSVFKIEADGSVGPEIQKIRYSGSGPNAGRQDASHIHCARYCRCGKYIFVTDLGNDALYRYNVSPEGEGFYIDESTLKVFRMAPGSGPRHFVFDREGDFMYLANELAASVSVLRYEHGEIKLLQDIASSRNARGDGGDIKISPDGHYVYMSVRENGDDGIAVYRRDGATGLLTASGYQPCAEHPRNIEFSPGGNFLFVAGMKADKVQVFACNADGSLTDTGRDIEVPSPTCLVFTERHM